MNGSGGPGFDKQFATRGCFTARVQFCMRAEFNRRLPLLALAVLALIVALGCKSNTLRVNIAKGYKGVVKISCGPNEDEPHPITVDPTGLIDNAACPRSRTDLLIIKDGTPTSTEGPIRWDFTGDGIPVDIQFAVN
jgi:hypothetical protein